MPPAPIVPTEPPSKWVRTKWGATLRTNAIASWAPVTTAVRPMPSTRNSSPMEAIAREVASECRSLRWSTVAVVELPNPCKTPGLQECGAKLRLPPVRPTRRAWSQNKFPAAPQDRRVPSALRNSASKRLRRLVAAEINVAMSRAIAAAPEHSTRLHQSKLKVAVSRPGSCFGTDTLGATAHERKHARCSSIKALT